MSSIPAWIKYLLIMLVAFILGGSAFWLYDKYLPSEKKESSPSSTRVTTTKKIQPTKQSEALIVGTFTPPNSEETVPKILSVDKKGVLRAYDPKTKNSLA